MEAVLNGMQRILPWGLLFGFIIAVEYFLDWSRVLEPWPAFSLWHLVLGLGMILLSYVLRTWRLMDYCPELVQGRWVMALRLTLFHNLFSSLLPARAGELSFPVMMKRYFDASYAQSMSALLWFRLLDLHTILIFAWYPLLAVTPLRRFAIPIVLLWMLIPPVVYGLRNVIARRYVGTDGQWSEWVQQTLLGLPDSVSSFWRSWVLTWLNWGVKLAALAWLMGQFIDNVSWNLLLGSVVAGELTTFLSFQAPAGVVTYEAGIVAILVSFTTTTLETAAIAAINVHLFVLAAAIIAGALAWFLPAKQAAKQASQTEAG